MKVYFTAPTMDTAIKQLDLINRTTGLDLTIHEALVDIRDVEWLEDKKFKYIAYDEMMHGISRKQKDRFNEMCCQLNILEKIGQCKKVYIRDRQGN